MTALLHPSYFPSIVSLSVIVNAGHILLEAADNFQKQTYRNRMYIYGANGRLILQVPIKHTKADGHQLYKDVRVENAFPWQARHWKSLETAYRSSPYFEYYEDALRPLFVEQHSSLLDLNVKTIETISLLLGFELKFTRTTSYLKGADTVVDHRYLVNAKREAPFSLERYPQVFEEKHGFLPNLSILDLLFNEGPHALEYLRRQKIPRLSDL